MSLKVDVMRRIKSVLQPQNVIDILYRAEDITSFHLSDLRLKEADIIIRPPVKHLTWADFDKIEEIISAGELVAKENIIDIKRLVHRNSYLLKIEHHIKKLKGDA